MYSERSIVYFSFQKTIVNNSSVGTNSNFKNCLHLTTIVMMPRKKKAEPYIQESFDYHQTYQKPQMSSLHNKILRFQHLGGGGIDACMIFINCYIINDILKNQRQLYHNRLILFMPVHEARKGSDKPNRYCRLKNYLNKNLMQLSN